MSAVFHTVGRVNAAEAVRGQLESLIQSGDLKPGEKLPPEKELARLFGVSRPIVREALGSLRAVGAIVSYSGRGSFVATTVPERPLLQGRYSLSELYEVRSLIETDGAALAAQRRTEADVERLGQIIESLENCSDTEEWSRLDAALHIAIAEATGNQVRVELVEHLRDLLVEQANVAVAIAGRMPQAEQEHRAIYDAVEAGDARAAKHAMSVHLENTYGALGIGRFLPDRQRMK
jgi:GntR family transcriptional repressor for pyruvate dehydrogenase complex